MSNKQQLQTNNTKYASLIETLRGKAAGTSGEDVTEETNAYTTKIATLETAVAALETELEGKASGGPGGASVETYTGKLVASSSIGLSYPFVLTYTTDNLEAFTANPDPSASEYVFTVPKNTIIFINATRCTATSGCTLLGGGTGSYAYLITDNNFVITAPM